MACTLWTDSPPVSPPDYTNIAYAMWKLRSLLSSAQRDCNNGGYSDEYLQDILYSNSDVKTVNGIETYFFYVYCALGELQELAECGGDVKKFKIGELSLEFNDDAKLTKEQIIEKQAALNAKYMPSGYSGGCVPLAAVECPPMCITPWSIGNKGCGC